jgi:hypothetical protein
MEPAIPAENLQLMSEAFAGADPARQTGILGR